MPRLRAAAIWPDGTERMALRTISATKAPDIDDLRDADRHIGVHAVAERRKGVVAKEHHDQHRDAPQDEDVGGDQARAAEPPTASRAMPNTMPSSVPSRDDDAASQSVTMRRCSR